MSKSFGCLIAIIIILGMGIPSLIAVYRSALQDTPEIMDEESVRPFRPASQLDIGVVGTDFHWEFRYPGTDGVLGTADDQFSSRILHVPQNARVKFHITSEDYIYILGIPKNENGSQLVENGEPEKTREIAVPSLTHFIEHQFTSIGTYDLMVDPLCGFQSIHDPRMGQILVSQDYEFESLFPEGKDTSEITDPVDTGPF